MSTNTLDVELRPIDAIRPYEGNPRVNDQAVDAVAASLKEFGFRQPIVADADGVIIVGHTRWKAAKKLGLTQVPVHVATVFRKTYTQPLPKGTQIIERRGQRVALWHDKRGRKHYEQITTGRRGQVKIIRESPT